MEYNASDLLSDSETNESWFFLVNQTYTVMTHMNQFF